MDRKKKKILYAVLLVIFAAVFLISAAVMVNYFVESWKRQKEYDKLLQDKLNATDPSASVPVVTIPAPVPSSDVTDSSETTETTEPSKQVLPEYAQLYLDNPELVGWITIPNTKIDYPVMQSSLDNRDYYLKRNFYGDYSDHGCIYVREECDVQSPSDNLTLYGHHMKDGSMFAGLMQYQKQSFWEEHKTFTFDTLTEHHTYEVIAVFKTSGTAGKGYPFHMFVDAESEADFDKFVSDIKGMAFYDTGLTAEYGDKLLCLTTCEYTLSNGRFVVVAKRIS